MYGSRAGLCKEPGKPVIQRGDNGGPWLAWLAVPPHGVTFVDLDLKHTSCDIAIATSFTLYTSSCCTSIACTAIIVCFKLHLPLAKDTKKAAQTSQGRPQSQLALLLVRQSFRASAISTLSRIRLLAPKLPSLSHAAVEAAAQSPSIGQSLNGNRHRTKPTSPTLCLAPWHTLVI